jgi:large subunit ribosomal protein L31
MKKNFHPDYHQITVVMTDGSEFSTRSTWGKPGDKLYLEVDPKSHIAWTKEQHFVETGQLARFNQRFQGLGKFAMVRPAPKGEAKTDEAKTDEAKTEA